ncbi:MAG: Oxygen-independent coproporphyrinogen-III oxidase 1 [Bacteroidetes bacterium ADurb.Bin035]|nr:MAG: Oxygen-independent coproporphyrinogen-III oxidase 1 [Bacteroidetes bacterium ADurb.Bin035]HOC40179.1 radical SAM family heme chaperone HemW [Bacteroidales bacterium]HOH93497.1 radical SAM family heme chaperone HemW [Bacteroidales bacterium]HQH58875.1 radical SAM family heme chaperone HemW [Bacteroidales bacterium]HQM77912.1 radical SAM family heme chaperone HemW [Bacteroidales bacterium]
MNNETSYTINSILSDHNYSLAEHLYIHVPFCRYRCPYCSFYSTLYLNDDTKNQFVSASINEIKLKDFLLSKNLKTIYLGGGTPSMLSITDIAKIFNEINRNHQIDDNAEITIEANPEDITKELVIGWQKIGINRVSLGVQNINEKHLQFLGRKHTKKQIINAIETLKNADFKNISLDFIIGLPEENIEDLKNNFQIILDYKIPHFSSYLLTIEEKTRLSNIVHKHPEILQDDDTTIKNISQWYLWAKNNGYQHYEVSNFAISPFQSKHNSSYWTQKNYIGIGPSAHSYIHPYRLWNTSSLRNYNNVKNDKLDFQYEILNEKNIFNEYIMTRLRLKEGVDLSDLTLRFNKKIAQYFIDQANKIPKEFIIKTDDKIYLTEEGWLIMDRILIDLFL